MTAPNDDRPEVRIGLLWHASGAGNLGMGALTVGNIIAVRKATDALGLRPRFTILEFPTDLPPYVEGPDIELFQISTRSMASPSGYFTKMRQLDCVLDIGGGDSFTDLYGPKRFAFLWGTKALAILAGAPLLFSPQTIGPFTRQPYTALGAFVMRRAAAVIARDPQSFAAISEMAPRARALQSVDVAFHLPFERPARKPGGPLEVGVNVSALMFRPFFDLKTDLDYPALMRQFLADLTARDDVRVHLISHVYSDQMPEEDDRRVARQLAAEFPGVVVAPDFPSPSAAKSYISGLDFLVAGRMHACIAAYSAGVPVVPMAYSRKFSGLFEGVLDYRYSIPQTGVSNAEALALLHKFLAERAELAAAIKRSQVTIDKAVEVYDAELRRLLQSVVGRRKRGR